MNDKPVTQDGPQEPVKPGMAVRLFLIVLPVGLAFMVPISLWIYYQKKYAPPPAASQFAVMLRRDLNAEDFARYRRILEQDIGERSVKQPEHLAAAEAFIESTLGYDNMGYAVRRLPFDAQGREMSNYVAELPGTARPQEVVLVLASYDRADASGIAALLCTAHALTGQPLERTVRFAAVVHESGVTKLALEERQTPGAVHAVLALGPLPGDKPGAWEGAAWHPVAFNTEADSAARLEELQALAEAIRTAAR